MEHNSQRNPLSLQSLADLARLAKEATGMVRSDREFRRKKEEFERRVTQLAAYAVMHGEHDTEVSGSGMSAYNRAFDRYAVSTDSATAPTGKYIMLETTDRHGVLTGLDKKSLDVLREKGSAYDTFLLRLEQGEETLEIDFNIHGRSHELTNVWITKKKDGQSELTSPYDRHTQGAFHSLPKNMQETIFDICAPVFDAIEARLPGSPRLGAAPLLPSVK